VSDELEYNDLVASGETPSGGVTKADVEAKMKELNIEGWSSMSEPTPETHLSCLNEIERIVEARRNAARSRTNLGE